MDPSRFHTKHLYNNPHKSKLPHPNPVTFPLLNPTTRPLFLKSRFRNHQTLMATTSLKTSLTLHLRSPSLLTCAPASSLRFTPHRRHLCVVAATPFSGDLRPDIGENAEGIISGEWPDNFSYLSYDDLRVYLETQILTHDKVKPKDLLGEVMSAPVRAVTQNQRLEEIVHHFEMVSGLPVVDGELRCIGVISKKDVDKASNGLQSRVSEVMSSPATTLSPDKTILDAAALMLKMKIHRIPVLNEQGQVVGIVTRSDVFKVLESAVV